MKVAVAFDHRGVHLREAVLEALAGHEILDFGTDTDAVRIDYPDKAREIGEAIQRGEAVRGVLVCGSGVGASVAACKLDSPPRVPPEGCAFARPGLGAQRTVTVRFSNRWTAPKS